MKRIILSHINACLINQSKLMKSIRGNKIRLRNHKLKKLKATRSDIDQAVKVLKTNAIIKSLIFRLLLHPAA